MSILLGAQGGYVQPPEPPPPALIRPQFITGLPLAQSWLGWDGSAWSLTEDGSGVALMPGVRGLTMPPVDRYRDTSPATPGSRYRGSRTLEREVFWPLSVYRDAASQDWADFDAAFWKTMHPEHTGLWVVQQPNGTTRMLRCRFVDDGQHAFDIDPLLLGWTSYGISMVAEDPYWRGEPVVRVFEEQPGQNFFGGDASPSGGPPFFISSSNTLSKASIDNDGDVDAYPTYTIEGPTAFVSVGIGTAITEVPFPLAAGESVEINTDPAAQIARDNLCRDRTAELGKVSFAAVPPGQGIALTVSMVGTGRVSVSISPAHYRAWG